MSRIDINEFLPSMEERSEKWRNFKPSMETAFSDENVCVDEFKTMWLECARHGATDNSLRCILLPLFGQRW